MTTLGFIFNSLINLIYCEAICYAGKKGFLGFHYASAKSIFKIYCTLSLIMIVLTGRMTQVLDFYFISFYGMVILPMRKHEFPVKHEEQKLS